MENKEHTSRLDAMITLFGMNNLQARAYSLYSKKPELLSAEEMMSVAKDLNDDILSNKKSIAAGAIVGAGLAYAVMTYGV